MTTSSFSPVHQLDAAIRSHNPFSGATIDKAQSVWGKGYPDLSTLNAHASQKVLELIKQVKTSQYSKDKVATLTITGDPGLGKTQIIGRLRRYIIDDGTALFVYSNAGKYGGLKLIKYQFVQTLVEELSRIGSQGVTQWQEVAAALVNASNSKSQKTPAEAIVKKFDHVYAKWLQNNQNLIKNLSDQICKNKPYIDSYILRAILWTLSQCYAPYAVQWLAGNELDQSTAEIMGLPTNAHKTAQDKEDEAISKINKILKLISEHKPIVICFDELDPDKVDPDTGVTLPQAIARLVKNIYDNSEQSEIGQGVVILTVMFQSVWVHHIKPLKDTSGSSVVDRMSTATQSNPVTLEPLNKQSIVDLVALWLQEELYKPHNLTPQDPVYPFTKNQLMTVGQNKPTVREALDWCAKKWLELGKIITPEDRFKQALHEAEAINEENLSIYLEDNAKISDALRFGFENLIGRTLEGTTSTEQQLKQVIIDKVETVNDDWVKLKVSGTENNSNFSIGIAVIQQRGAVAVKNGLKKSLADENRYSELGITRGCLVRGEDRTIGRHTQAYLFLEKLTNKMGGEWAFLEVESLKSLINLQTVYENCQSYYLSTDQVRDYSREEISKNKLLLEILSDPSGVINEEAILQQEIFSVSFDESSTDGEENAQAVNEDPFSEIEEI